ncbi:Piso0_002025 [Millerozyma farinosa CBS 7064]|uniref:Sulfhydryl oxidase n=1 Tax=Pichia sorbitophila (strain ATCC MYA-4447 / BCRC 22081 / CBS 7064 / NBRC 10061 / NRRL Y-12695) TaxID=559304 RepID=G8YMB9_PICSO|nr:Piso0_002025 [Millerozyma farinosa CBS 7064]
MVEESKEDRGPQVVERPESGVTGRKIIYDKDGKPCRACNTLLDFRMATGGSVASGSTQSKPKDSFEKKETVPSKDCPPDVEELGRSSWTLLHSIAATYPEKPTGDQQSNLKQFISLFGKLYPCWFCGEDFQSYVEKKEPQVMTQEAFGRWLCDAHNEVNIKLGKPTFDCNLWKQRWKDGWDDGRCD